MSDSPKTAQDKWMEHPAIGVNLSAVRPQNAGASGGPARSSNSSSGEDAQQRYEEALAVVEPKYKALPQPLSRSLEPLRQALDATYSEMKTAEANGLLAQALDKANELSANMADYSRAVAELDEKKQAFEKDLKAFQAKLAQASTSTSQDEQAAQDELMALQQAMEQAVADADYAAASKALGQLKPKGEALLAARQKKAAVDTAKVDEAELQRQRQEYQQSLAQLRSRMPDQTESVGGRIDELQLGMEQSIAKADAAASKNDFPTAMKHLATLDGQISEFELVSDAKARYEARRAEVEGKLPPSGDKVDAATNKLLKELEGQRAKADARAKASDFEGAIKELSTIEALLSKYQDQTNAGELFRKRWAEVKPGVPTTTATTTSPTMLKSLEAIAKSRKAVEAAEASGEFEKGLVEVDKVVVLLAAFNEAKQKAALVRTDFESAYALLKKPIEDALADPTTVKEVKARQADLAAKKKALDAAVARNDFEAAQAQLSDAQAALAALLAERSKSAVDKGQVAHMAGRLTTAITMTYMQTQAKIDHAATAYDAALGKHKGALDKVRGAKQLAADIVSGVFFAALGGFVGGALGGGIKSKIEEEFGKAAAGGAILDATKDVAKYLTKTTEKMRGKVDDPTAISLKVGGNGTELARNMGAAVNEQGAKLLETVAQWWNVIIEADKAGEDTVRVDLTAGDPYDSIVNDSFLKIVKGIKGTETDFSKALWAQWIDDQAYVLDEQCTEWDCQSVTRSEVDSVFSWWADLKDAIKAQTGTDFGLQARLDAARKNVEAKAKALNNENFFKR